MFHGCADAKILGNVPTPVVAFLTSKCEMDVGIMVTASPISTMGFKILLFGKKLTDIEEKVIREFMTVLESIDTEAKTAKLGEKIIWNEGVAYYMNKSNHG